MCFDLHVKLKWVNTHCEPHSTTAALKPASKRSVYVQTLNTSAVSNLQFSFASETEWSLVLQSQWFKNKNTETALKKWINPQFYIQHCMVGLVDMLTTKERPPQETKEKHELCSSAEETYFKYVLTLLSLWKSL